MPKSHRGTGFREREQLLKPKGSSKHLGAITDGRHKSATQLSLAHADASRHRLDAFFSVRGEARHHFLDEGIGRCDRATARRNQRLSDCDPSGRRTPFEQPLRSVIDCLSAPQLIERNVSTG